MSDSKEHKFLNTNDKFWIGPYGVLVRHNLYSVVATDGYNVVYHDGYITDLVKKNSLSMNENVYKKLYANLNESNGKWYYKH
ncbi:hypothetical protein QLL95_gp0325 [Cotonvirus japonicus]|uniref:Uncharacterized protein n=1 Tax=Cotonvirus japonicus TaxID=2811091 RepID=A0ABM7NRN5_9VIRU|nr:hypothetical protein QLL95_gp0325 [Cotonvirus japonicus]BCS82814.1 hypothetical protein [Cotonvirus japonicus]